MHRINERVVRLNDKRPNTSARHVQYCMQMYKRTSHNHALTFAIRAAVRFEKVYRVGEDVPKLPSLFRRGG